MIISRKIKVLECIRQGQIGGGESHLLSLVENMDRTKFDPLVLSFTDGPMIKRLQNLDVHTKVVYTEKPFDIRKWGVVKKYMQENKVDIVHAHGTRANSNVLWAARSLGIPVIYTVHGWSFHQDQNMLVKKLRVLGEKYLTSRSDINISVSASNQQSGKYQIPAFRSIVVNNGIDIHKFDPEKKYKDIRKELGIPENEVLVLFIARFTLQKQPLQLIEAFKRVQQKNPAMHLLMVGEGEQKSLAEDIIRSEKLQNKITLQPFRQDVPDILAAADIFVLPSLWEGLPIGLLEAMAMGKAVIASKVDGTAEIIAHDQNGLMIDTSNLVEELASSLFRLSKDSELRLKFSINAVETIKNRFNASKMTREIENIYSDLYNKSVTSK